MNTVTGVYWNKETQLCEVAITALKLILSGISNSRLQHIQVRFRNVHQIDGYYKIMCVSSMG